VKKMAKGDAKWSTRKLVLGWIIDTVRGTIELPPHRVDRLLEILSSIQPNQKQIATQSWHQIIGELRSMVSAISGARGLFSTLQEAFRHPDPARSRLRLHKHVHDFLEDFRWIANSLAERPTRIAELVPARTPHTIGACDAAGTGMGGVHFVPIQGRLQPILWRQKFTPAIQTELVSFDNPTGKISNSDLELAGSVAHADIIAQFTDVRERTLQHLYDNTPTVCWQRKGSTTTTGPAAYLLRIQAIHQRHFRYVSRHDYIPGPANVMADFCSRAWHLSDSQLLSHFDTQFPQDEPWQCCHLRRPMNLSLISALFKKRSDPGLLLNEPKHTTNIGTDGLNSVLKMALTHSFATTRIQSPFSRCLVSDTEMAVSHPATTPYGLGQWRTASAPLGRNFPAWGSGTYAKMPTARSISE